MNRTWSRKKIFDEFTTLRKADGSPMSRQQIHMLRKKERGICLTCSEPAIGVYCLKHTIAARERMRHRLNYRRRLRKSPSYILEKQVPSKRHIVRLRPGMRHGLPAGLQSAPRMPRSKAHARTAAALKA
jgi:RNase P protein component